MNPCLWSNMYIYIHIFYLFDFFIEVQSCFFLHIYIMYHKVSCEIPGAETVHYLTAFILKMNTKFYLLLRLSRGSWAVWRINTCLCYIAHHSRSWHSVIGISLAPFRIRISAQASFNFTVSCALTTLISHYTIEFLWAFEKMLMKTLSHEIDLLPKPLFCH